MQGCDSQLGEIPEGLQPQTQQEMIYGNGLFTTAPGAAESLPQLGDLTIRAVQHSWKAYPSDDGLDESIDDVARNYLQQCKDSLHAPSGAVMLAASAVDAMLKVKGYKDGSLYQRIKDAAAGHIITADMAAWAHQVRLDANDERHADESAQFPTAEEAQRSLDFSTALAEIMFVLPARVTRGLQESVN